MKALNQVAGLVALGTIGAIAFSLALNYLLLLDPTLTSFNRILISAIVVPPAIAAPLSILLAFKQEEIKRLRQTLSRDATYDPATSFLKPKVFSSLVDRRMNVGLTGTSRPGAFLIIDVENLRLINMRHGLDWREEVLRVVAGVIRTSVRSDDVVGRLGETEFGIYLPGATEENAYQVAERIRAGIMMNYFGTKEERAEIKVTVGGLLFENPIEFEKMFLAAERKLVEAQESGVTELSWQSYSDRRAN